MLIPILSAMLLGAEPGPRYEALSVPPPPATAGQPALEAPDPIALASDNHQRMTVPVRIGGQGPFHFLVDTGSERTAVSRELAARLGLGAGPRAIVHSATGASRVAMALIPELTLSRRTTRDIEAPLLGAADMGADGIIGIDALRAQRLQFDFAAGALSITSADGRIVDDPGTIIVRARRRDGRLVITDATAEGMRVSVLIDSGSQYSVGNMALRRALERRGALTIVGPIELVSVTGKSLTGELAMIRDLEIGGIRLNQLAMVFADAHSFRQLDLDRGPAVLLGMNGLRSFDKVTIDFASRKIRFLLPSGKGVRLAVGD